MMNPLREWKALALQLFERLVKPSTRPTAFFYLLLAVAALGGVGVWLTQCLVSFDQAKPRDLALGVITYALAIVFTSIGDLILERGASRNLKFILYFLAACAMLVCGRLTYTTIYKAPSTVSWGTLLIAVVPVWVTWWLINGVDDRFVLDTEPAAAIGGDPRQDL